ncbi:MAG: flagellar export protein FliJ [Desulfobacteraceae bacterium]|nr:flagellar export protein FliJ [Desulfobacteraceae bacterium]
MYKFRLQALLEYKKHIEDTLQGELGEIRLQLAAEERKMELLSKKEDDIKTKLKRLQEAPSTANEIIMYHQYLARLGHDLGRQQKQVIAIESRCEEKRLEVVEAMKKRQILEKLKEKGLQAYSKKLLKKEQDFLNEVAVTRFNRRR